MAYVDGFILAVPDDKMEEYKESARLGEKVWKEYGALDYVECIADDVPYGEVTSFPRAVQAKEDETVIFSWAVYKSREHRDGVLKKVMAAPGVEMDAELLPFDGKRLMYGGFPPLLGL